MAGASLLTLLDDIATILDDVAAMTKVAAKKTAGVLGDDLALNAQQVAGVRAERELPVVWAVAVGSLKNKVILVPAALAIAALERLSGWPLILPLLMLGGLFLCFEGAEKLWHSYQHRKHGAHDSATSEAAAESAPLDEAQLREMEREKVKGAITTDFVLSAEIIVISLGTVATQPFGTQLAVLTGISLVMTVGVYGLVAAIVKMDDAGFYLCAKKSYPARVIGTGLLRTAPWLMKLLGIVGTAAMFMVGGGILLHGIAPLEHALHAILPQGGVLGVLASSLATLVIGLIAGAICVLLFGLIQRLKPARTAEQAG